MSFSVIIPSCTLSNLLPCIETVQQHEPTARIIVVWDASHGQEAPEVPTADVITLRERFQFSRNVNAGINAAGSDDCLILNDDALLQSPGGFSLLQRESQLHPEFGVISAVTRHVGNRNQFPRGIGLREDSRMVCFISVLIPRRTIDAVGLLDEQFDCYSHQDDDYCVRVRQAGLKIGIHDGCLIDHGSLKSTFRGNPGAGGGLEVGTEIFRRKWGVDNRAI